MLPANVARFVVDLVSLAWVANFVAPFFSTTYVAGPQLNVVFMSIVGGALAFSRSRKRDGAS